METAQFEFRTKIFGRESTINKSLGCGRNDVDFINSNQAPRNVRHKQTVAREPNMGLAHTDWEIHTACAPERRFGRKQNTLLLRERDAVFRG
jgi:hypothetical protein